MTLQNTFAKRDKGVICLSIILAQTKCIPMTPIKIKSIALISPKGESCLVLSFGYKARTSSPPFKVRLVEMFLSGLIFSEN